MRKSKGNEQAWEREERDAEGSEICNYKMTSL